MNRGRTMLFTEHHFPVLAYQTVEKNVLRVYHVRFTSLERASKTEYYPRISARGMV